MYEYTSQKTGPHISSLPPEQRAAFIPKLKKPRDPHGEIEGESVDLYFAFELDRYPELVEMLNKYPGESLGQFVRKEIARWKKGHYISANYDLSYKPVHIVESTQLRVSVSRSTRNSLNKASEKHGFTVSALVRVLVERRMDEIAVIFGPCNISQSFRP